MQYSSGLNARMVQNVLDPAAMSACGLSRETGVSQGTLSRWFRKAGVVNGVSKQGEHPAGKGDPAARRPQDWSADEKLKAVIEASKLRVCNEITDHSGASRRYMRCGRCRADDPGEV